MQKKPRPIYSRALISEIKAAAKRAYGRKVRVTHIYPRAYCVAKPAAWAAAFVVPPQDMKRNLPPDVVIRPSVFIQDCSAANVEVGQWHCIAYISTQISGGTRVIPMHEQSNK